MLRLLLAFAACLGVTGCALLQPPRPTPPAAAPLEDTVIIGKTTKADARAVLGEAVVIDFLFAPSGVLMKIRTAGDRALTHSG